MMCIPYIYSQNANEKFGKNRVQYSNDQEDWWMYETKTFLIHWYGKARSQAEFCVNIAEEESKEFQKTFEHHINDKIELIIYTDQTDLNQSNFLLDEDAAYIALHSEPKIIGNKMLLYFNGSYVDFRNQLRKGIIKVYLKSIFTGSSIQEKVLNAIILKLPSWFESGLVEYLSEGWSPTNHQALQEYIQLKKTSSFKKLSKQNPTLAGKSMWHFLHEQNGKKVIANILYLTRINHNVNAASVLSIGQKWKDVEQDWLHYYQHHPPEIIRSKDESILQLKWNEKKHISRIISHPQENKLIIITNDLGKAKVVSYDIDKQKSQTIFKFGKRNRIQKPNTNYPIFYWHPNGKDFGIIYESRDKICYKLYQHNHISKHTFPQDIRNVYAAIQYSNESLLLSANASGSSDVIEYSLKSRQYTKITDDKFDDLQLQKTGTQISLISNRPNTTLDSTEALPIDFWKAQLFDTEKKRLSEIYADQHSVTQYLKSDKSLAIVQDMGLFELSSNNTANLIYASPRIQIGSLHDVTNTIYVVEQSNKGNKLLRIPLNKIPIKIESKKQTERQDSTFINAKSLLEDTLLIDYSKYVNQFQSPFKNPVNVLELLKEFDETTGKPLQTINHKKQGATTIQTKPNYTTIEPFISNNAIASRLRYRIEDVDMDVNNDILFEGLDNYSGYKRDYKLEPLGILFKAKFLDHFENYPIEFGVRIPLQFNGNEAYLLFENRKKRLDHIFALYRKAEKTETEGSGFISPKLKTNTIISSYQLKYPFDIYRSIRAQAIVRHDHQYFSSTTPQTLETPDFREQRFGLRLEYVYDDIFVIGPNLKEGRQWKVFVEGSKKFDIQTTDGLHISAPKSELFVAGADVRSFWRVLQKSIIATRLYYATSFGRERVLYLLGGTENWLFPKYAPNSPLDPSIQNIQFQTIATEIRGHDIGARKGTTTGLISAECRIPVFQYLLQDGTKNSFFKNIQFLAFVDAGMAWTKTWPWQAETAVNYSLENPITSVQVKYYRNPIIAGTGWGLRIPVLSYTLRFDYAWKIQQQKLSKPAIYHLSLGWDF